MNFTTILIIFSNLIGILVSVLAISEMIKQKRFKHKTDIHLISVYFLFGLSCFFGLFNLGG